MNIEMLKALLLKKLDQLHANGAVCCVMLFAIILILLPGCALDQAAIERKRQDLSFLCENPSTVTLKELCDRVAPGVGGPVDLTKPE